MITLDRLEGKIDAIATKLETHDKAQDVQHLSFHNQLQAIAEAQGKLLVAMNHIRGFVLLELSELEAVREVLDGQLKRVNDLHRDLLELHAPEVKKAKRRRERVVEKYCGKKVRR